MSIFKDLQFKIENSEKCTAVYEACAQEVVLVLTKAGVIAVALMLESVKEICCPASPNEQPSVGGKVGFLHF